MSQTDVPTETTGPSRRRLGRADWVRRALEVLAGEGVDALSIGRLCRLMGVTKGSFYWHFRSREDLLRATADSWSEDRIGTLLRGVRAEQAPGLPRLGSFFGRVLTTSRLERSMRAWATHDSIAATAVSRADAEVAEFTREELLAAGAAPEKAAGLASLCLAAGAGVSVLNVDLTPGELEQLIALGLELVQSQLEAPSA